MLTNFLSLPILRHTEEGNPSCHRALLHNKSQFFFRGNWRQSRGGHLYRCLHFEWLSSTSHQILLKVRGWLTPSLVKFLKFLNFLISFNKLIIEFKNEWRGATVSRRLRSPKCSRYESSTANWPAWRSIVVVWRRWNWWPVVDVLKLTTRVHSRGDRGKFVKL